MPDIWPLLSEFRQVAKHPRHAFQDERLKQLQFEITPTDNLPRPWSGPCADVFRGTSPDGKAWAVRVFKEQDDARPERYSNIQSYFKTHNRPNSMVWFEYFDEEILIPNKRRYPLVFMEWVDGETIFHWAKSICGEGNRERLDAVYRNWQDVAKSLGKDEERGIEWCHGDLHHGNILVTPKDDLKLVDYDGIAVDTMFGKPNSVTGSLPYQHPSRNNDTKLGPHLDNFGTLTIGLALRALSLNPDLWREFVLERRSKSNGQLEKVDSFLFTKQDIDHPAHSPLVQRLAESNDGVTTRLVNALLQSLEGSIEEVPSLEMVLGSSTLGGPLQQPPAGLSSATPPADVAPTVARRSSADGAEFAPEGDRIPEVQSAAPQPTESRTALPPTDLQLAIEAAGDNVKPEAEQKIVDLSTEIIDEDCPEAERVRLATFRVQELARFINLCHEESLQELAKVRELLGCRRELDRLGALHWVDGKGRGAEWTNLAQLRVRANDAFEELKGQKASAQSDRKILEAWDDSACATWNKAREWFPRIEQARLRQEQYAEFERAAKARDSAKVVCYLSQPYWQDYEFPKEWAPIIRDATGLLKSIWDNVSAIEKGDPAGFLEVIDPKLVKDFWGTFEKCSARLDQLVDEVLRLNANNRLQLPMGQRPIMPFTAGKRLQFLLRWQWPLPKFCDRCFLAICPDVPDNDTPPAEVAMRHSWEIDVKKWKQGRMQYAIFVEQEYLGSHAVVWADLEVGKKRCYSEPLVLGKLERPPRKGFGKVFDLLK